MIIDQKDICYACSSVSAGYSADFFSCYVCVDNLAGVISREQISLCSASRPTTKVTV